MYKLPLHGTIFSTIGIPQETVVASEVQQRLSFAVIGANNFGDEDRVVAGFDGLYHGTFHGSQAILQHG